MTGFGFNNKFQLLTYERVIPGLTMSGNCFMSTRVISLKIEENEMIWNICTDQSERSHYVVTTQGYRGSVWPVMYYKMGVGMIILRNKGSPFYKRKQGVYPLFPLRGCFQNICTVLDMPISVCVQILMCSSSINCFVLDMLFDMAWYDSVLLTIL